MTELTMDLLDCALDDLSDLPENKNFPIGAHKALATIEVDKKNGQVAYLSFKGIETLELANPDTDEAISEGQECSTRYDTGNKWGNAGFKKVAAAFGEAIGSGSIRDIIEQTKDVEVVIITGLTEGNPKKEGDPIPVYLDVKELQVV